MMGTTAEHCISMLLVPIKHNEQNSLTCDTQLILNMSYRPVANYVVMWNL